jgi:4-hydroxy-2-oxoheptanedioate aldolase
MKKLILLLLLIWNVVAEPLGRVNRLIETVQQGKPILGIWCYDHSMRNAAALADSSLNFIIIDMEHGPLDFQVLGQFLQGMLSRRESNTSLSPRVTSIVRLPQNGREQLQFQIKQALDAGVYGLLLPHINTREEALAAVRASRYPQKIGVKDFDPPGLRGVAPDPPARYWGLPVADYVARADLWPLDPQGELFLMLQIEAKQGVDNIDSILDVPGISAIFIGPGDLSFSLGFPGDPSAAPVQEAIQKVLTACKKKGIPCGIDTTADLVEQRIKDGYQVLTIGEDPGIPGGVAEALARVERNSQQRK